MLITEFLNTAVLWWFTINFCFAAQTISSTLWAGTNSGQILVFLLNIPVGGAEKRNTEKATAMLAKEIQLKHKAPVINIQVFTQIKIKNTPC